MLVKERLRKNKRWIIWVASILFFLFIVSVLFVDRIVEPILRARLHTLIIEGSDSLYTYELEKLDANFFAGSVEVENLQIRVDSNRYKILKERNELPSLTMHLDLQKGYIKGLGVFSILFRKVIDISEIGSSQADIKLSRHIRRHDSLSGQGTPLWKAIQPKIKNIQIDRVKLDGVKFLYRNADTSESVKLQFDRCDALFGDIRVDSIASYDSTRLGFAKNVFIKFHDLKYRTPDSSSKMKAEWITYSSAGRLLEIEKFKIQPTLEEKEDFYKAVGVQQSMHVMEVEKVRITGIRLNQFINNDVIEGDSFIFKKPVISIYMDRSYPPPFKSKIGNYPHQKLLKASSFINIRHLVMRDADFTYTEKNEKTLREGNLVLKNVDLTADNVTNVGKHIKPNPICAAYVKGKILESSPIEARFIFYLDSANGEFEMNGSVRNVNAVQLNKLAIPLANVELQSFTIHQLDFNVKGEDFEANANVKMRYNDLSMTVRKTDTATGKTTTKKFLTKALNKYVLYNDNPGADGVERTAANAKAIRQSTKSFFGLIWKAIFAGMQNIMMKSGRI